MSMNGQLERRSGAGPAGGGLAGMFNVCMDARAGAAANVLGRASIMRADTCASEPTSASALSPCEPAARAAGTVADGGGGGPERLRLARAFSRANRRGGGRGASLHDAPSVRDSPTARGAAARACAFADARESVCREGCRQGWTGADARSGNICICITHSGAPARDTICTGMMACAPHLRWPWQLTDTCSREEILPGTDKQRKSHSPADCD